MYKKLVFLIVASIVLIGCSATQPQVASPGEKTFEQEDTYILFALRAEQIKNNKVAGELFLKLYNKSGKKEYLYRALQNLFVAKEYQSMIDSIQSVTTNPLEDDLKLARYEVFALYGKGELVAAEKLSKMVAQKSKSVDDYILTSDILMKEGKNDLALKYLEGAYVQEYNEKILDKIAIILYVNLHRKKDAIAELESHVKIHGCSELTCKALLRIYSNENDVDALLRTYKRMYAMQPNEQVAKKIIQIYAYKREFVKLMIFLEESKADDTILLELYKTAKDYVKAQKLALHLYNKTDSIDYLGQAAIYEYEANKENLSRKTLNDVIEKLTKVVDATHEPLYMNYLGYILIDHEIDVPRGIQYIKDVLQIQPDSGYYIDSLAWGYYKLGRCFKAYELIKKVRKLKGGDDPEVLAHEKIIRDCVKNPHHKKVVQKR